MGTNVTGRVPTIEDLRPSTIHDQPPTTKRVQLLQFNGGMRLAADSKLQPKRFPASLGKSKKKEGWTGIDTQRTSESTGAVAFVGNVYRFLTAPLVRSWRVRNGVPSTFQGDRRRPYELWT